MRTSQGHLVTLSFLIGMVVFGGVSLPAGMQKFSEWSMPENLGPAVNTAFTENTPFLSRDGQSLYFLSWLTGGGDLYVAHWDSVAATWGAAQVLGPNVNSPADQEYWPTLSPDGHRLYFSVFRNGNFDLYVSHRRDKKDDFGWEPAVPVSELNTPYNDVALSFFEDDATGDLIGYFTSSRRANFDGDLYMTRLLEDGTFAPPTPLSELNTTANSERLATIRRDGLEIFFNRGPGTATGQIFTAIRAIQAAAWSAPTALSAPINDGVSTNVAPRLSFDGTQLYFASTRGGNNLDLYVSIRNKVHMP